MTEVEAAIAAEIRHIARDELALAFDAENDDELAGALDSLALLALVVAVEDRFRVALTEADTAEARTLADLSRLIARRAGGPVAVGRRLVPRRGGLK